MKVLLGCEFSGIGRQAFAAMGHETWSCDLDPSEDNSPFHIIGDVRKVLANGWDLAILHPPCTYLTNSGIRWLYKGGAANGKPLTRETRDEARYQELLLARAFFLELYSAPIPRICIENPRPHVYAGIPSSSQVIHPWMFGHAENKETHLWLQGLPELTATKVIHLRKNKSTMEDEGRESLIHMAPPSDHRQKDRSRSYPGIMAAMAQQWSFL